MLRPSYTPHGWTHPQCEECWYADQGRRQPVRLKEPELTVCCFCGRPTQSGIYRRAKGAEVPSCPDNASEAASG